MDDHKKSKSQLIEELRAARHEVANFRESSAKLQRQLLNCVPNSLNAITEHDPDIIARFDNQLRHTYINRRIEQATGLPADSFLGKTNREMGMPSELVQDWEGTLRQVFETAQPSTIEFSFPSEAGEKFFESRVIPEMNGSAKVNSVLVICRDITSFRVAEKEVLFQTRLLNTVEQAVIATKIDGAIIFWNRVAESLYGWKREEVLGKNVMEITVPEVEQGHANNILAQLKRGESWSGEFNVRRKDGSVFPVSITDTAIFDDHKNLIGIVGISKDISENKKADEALRQAEAKYRALVEHSLQGISIYQNGRVVFANQVLADIVGYTIPEMMALTEEQTLAIIHPEDRPEIDARLALFQSGEKTESYSSARLIRKDGAIRWVELSSTATAFEKLPAIQTFVIDITERFLAEQALKQSENKLREMFENSPDAIFVHDRDGNLLDVNQAACRLHNMDYDELVKKNVRDLVPEDQSENAYQYVQRLFKIGYGHTEGLSRTKEGKCVPVEFRAQRFEYGGQPALLFHVHDISSRKQIEQQLLQSQKMEAIGRLAGGIAHDFNNLLTVIIGNAQFGLQESQPRDPVHQDLIRIENAATQARDLVSQLLAFSRSQIFRPRHLNLNHIISDHVKLVKRIIGENIEIVTRLEPILALAAVDEAQIHQVMMNLSVNARDAMPQGGRLSIESRNFIADKNSFKRDGYLKGDYQAIHKLREFVEITVSDNGVGMEKETQSHIFEPFFTTKPLGKGTGLGLAVVYGIVEQHGGFIHVESQLMKGSTFRLYFPAVSAPRMRKKTQTSVPSIDGSGETILVVEDNRTVLKVAARILETLGYQVLTAYTSREGMRIFEANCSRIDLVVMDVVMPDGSGPAIYTQFANIKPQLPVIFVTGHDVYSELHGFLETVRAPVQLLQKPYTKESLGTSVKTILREIAGA